ncbi:MAG TPA: hypothetical protein VFW65_29765 [Pseudonocardiaceae bacterium]|nr:hypothetical protein [Pseudonocardiaceae bacterium]
MTDRVARRVTVVVLLAVALAGCAGPRPAPPRPTRTTSVSPTPGQPSIADPDRACRGGIPFYSGSPAYAGPGPHLMIGFPLHDDSLSQRIILNDLPSRLPDAWAADQSDVPEVFAVGPDVSTFQHAQLILCMSPPQVTGRTTGTCEYGDAGAAFAGAGGGVKIDVVAATYDFTVFESSTGRVVESFRLTGSGGTCPLQVDLGLGDARKIADIFDGDTLVAKLRPLVEGRAPH